jgi:hypothetical protein
MNEDHDDLLILFQEKLRDLEKESPKICRSQFEKLYLERAQAICDDILKDLQGAYRDFLKNNTDIAEEELLLVLNDFLRNHEPLPRTTIVFDPIQSMHREYMSVFKPEAFRQLVDQYRAGVRAPS